MLCYSLAIVSHLPSIFERNSPAKSILVPDESDRTFVRLVHRCTGDTSVNWQLPSPVVAFVARRRTDGR